MMTENVPSTRKFFDGVTHLKVHVNFDIPLFEIHIYGDDLNEWLNMLEFYYSIQKKIDDEKK
jgi:hypothetical protein